MEGGSIGGGGEGGLDVEVMGGKGLGREECIFSCEGIALGVGKNSVELGGDIFSYWSVFFWWRDFLLWRRLTTAKGSSIHWLFIDFLV